MFLITGGGSGIGGALSLELASRNQKVLIVGRNKDKLLEFSSFSENIDYLIADVSNTKGREKIISHIEDNNLVLDGLIHNAGIISPITPLSQIKESEWRLAMATNLDAPLFLTQQLLPYLNNARVLNIGSGVAHFPVATWGAYCVSKAALYMLTCCWQQEFCCVEKNKIFFSSVMPGIIDTPMQEQIRNASSMDINKQLFFQELKNNKKLIASKTVALFLSWLLLDVDPLLYSSKEWDIYDSQHHDLWLKKPHYVPMLDGE